MKHFIIFIILISITISCNSKHEFYPQESQNITNHQVLSTLNPEKDNLASSISLQAGEMFNFLHYNLNLQLSKQTIIVQEGKTSPPDAHKYQSPIVIDISSIKQFSSKFIQENDILCDETQHLSDEILKKIGIDYILSNESLQSTITLDLLYKRINTSQNIQYSHINELKNYSLILRELTSHFVSMLYIQFKLKRYFDHYNTSPIYRKKILNKLSKSLFYINSANNSVPKILLATVNEYLHKKSIDTTDSHIENILQSIHFITIQSIQETCEDDELNAPRLSDYFEAFPEPILKVINIQDKFQRLYSDPFSYSYPIKTLISIQKLYKILDIIKLQEFWEQKSNVKVDENCTHPNCLAKQVDCYFPQNKKISITPQTYGSSNYWLILAHEYGHHIQNINNFWTTSNLHPKIISMCKELEADFFSGYYLSHSKGLNLSKPSLKALFDLHKKFGDPHPELKVEDRRAPHGDSHQREIAFSYGCLSGQDDDEITENTVTTLHEEFKQMILSTNFLKTLKVHLF